MVPGAARGRPGLEREISFRSSSQRIAQLFLGDAASVRPGEDSGGRRSWGTIDQRSLGLEDRNSTDRKPPHRCNVGFATPRSGMRTDIRYSREKALSTGSGVLYPCGQGRHQPRLSRCATVKERSHRATRIWEGPPVPGPAPARPNSSATTTAIARLCSAPPSSARPAAGPLERRRTSTRGPRRYRRGAACAIRPDNVCALRGAAADHLAQRAGEGRSVFRPDAADPRRPARGRDRPQEPLPEGRLDQPPDPLLQGPGRQHGDRPSTIELGKDEVGCVSTGNVGTAVAALAAKAGATAYIFYPGNMEKGKAKACRALGAQVCQLDGNYDQATAVELSLASGIEFANITLRPSSTPRGRRRWPSRSSSSSAGRRRTTS